MTTSPNDKSPDDPWQPFRIDGTAHQSPGLLIAVEGSDGVGKTSLIDGLLEVLTSKGLSSVFTKAPTPDLRAYPAWGLWFDGAAQQARAVIDGYGLSLMALGDRLVHQSMTVEPALMSGQIVVTDRYVLSSAVYESGPVHRLVLPRLLRPDIRVLLTADRDTVIQRLTARTYERLHPEDEAFKEELLRRYECLADMNDYEILRTDGPSVSELIERLSALVDRALLGRS